MLDASGRITDPNFQRIKEFVKDVIIDSSLEIDEKKTSVGVILFSTNATIHFDVTKYTDEDSLFNAIDSIPYTTGSTNTAEALNLLNTSGQRDGELKLRKGSTRIAIVVTDGGSNDKSATRTAASTLHASNIFDQVYAAGVGLADDVELNTIASDPSLVFLISDFDSIALRTLNERLTYKLSKCIGK